jgi:hypothetical protein
LTHADTVVTDIGVGADIRVIAGFTVGRRSTARLRDTRLGRAGVLIVAIDRRARDAFTCLTRVSCTAGITVIAGGVVEAGLAAHPSEAGVIRAWITIVTGHDGPANAGALFADIGLSARVAIFAGGAIGRLDATGLADAAVIRAGVLIVTSDRFSGETPADLITEITAGAGVTVVTRPRPRRVHAADIHLAGVDGARVVVIAVERQRTHAIALYAAVSERANIGVIAGVEVVVVDTPRTDDAALIGADVRVITDEVLPAREAAPPRADVSDRTRISVVAVRFIEGRRTALQWITDVIRARVPCVTGGRDVRQGAGQVHARVLCACIEVVTLCVIVTAALDLSVFAHHIVAAGVHGARVEVRTIVVGEALHAGIVEADPGVRALKVVITAAKWRTVTALVVNAVVDRAAQAVFTDAQICGSARGSDAEVDRRQGRLLREPRPVRSDEPQRDVAPAEWHVVKDDRCHRVLRRDVQTIQEDLDVEGVGRHDRLIDRELYRDGGPVWVEGDRLVVLRRGDVNLGADPRTVRRCAHTDPLLTGVIDRADVVVITARGGEDARRAPRPRHAGVGRAVIGVIAVKRTAPDTGLALAEV